MIGDQYPAVSLHNVAELAPAEWTADGDQLCRVPASVGAELNVSARERVRGPTNSELRFVPESDDAEIEVTLSAADRTRVWAFWGSFRPWKPFEIGPEPETHTFSVPERLAKLEADADADVDTGRFDRRVCRLRFERAPAVALHDVAGDCRPPTVDELPERRYLAYGTSITEGAASSAPHLKYASRVAREIDADLLNFGCSGSAYCEPAMADYIASRDDWDVATFALSVNMANRGFTLSQFRERADYFVNRVAEAHPEKPIACVTLFPYFADVIEGGDAERAANFRAALREIVAESPHENLSLVEGDELMELHGLAADLLHPGDTGMRAIGEGVAEHLADRLDT